MNVTNLPTLASSAGPKAPARTQQPQGPTTPPEKDEFKANSPDKNRIGYEVAYNFGSGVGAVFKGATKTGQFLHLTSSALGMQPGAFAGSLGMLGGTLDVAIGASTAKQSAFNRNMGGCVSGGLQVAQGVATWASIASGVFGAPAMVGRVASFAALGAFAARQGLAGYGAISSHFNKSEDAKPDASAGAASAATTGAVTQGLVGPSLAQVFEPQAAIKQSDVETREENDLLKQDRRFEKTFAAVNAVDQWAQRLGGVGALWTNIDAIRGTNPGPVWGMLGLVGSTYSIAQGVGGLKHAAVNRNLEATVTGTLGLVQGLGTVGAALGLGRPAAAVAVGAWVGKTAYSIYSQSKRFRGDNKEDSVATVIADNLKNSFWGTSRSVTKGGEQAQAA